jgi:integrase
VTPRRTKSKYTCVYYRQTPKGRAYEVSFRDHTGRQRWERVPGFDNIDQARDLLAERLGRKRKGEKNPPAGVRFGDVAELWIASARLEAWTRKNYRASLDNEILPRFGKKKLAEVDRQSIGLLVRKLEQRGLRKSSIENILKPMRATFKYAIEDAQPSLLLVSPFANLSESQRPAEDAEPYEPHEWDDVEIDKLLAAAKTRAASSTSRYDYAPLLTLAVRSGLRLGECLGLDWTACELERGGGVLHVRQQWTRLKELRPPKWKRRRDVPISDDLVRLLLELKIATLDKTGPVFVSRTGGRLSHRNVERRGFDPAADDAGLEDVSFHDLRHAYGSRLASRGLTARQIADAMGHKKTATTERYVQRYNGDQSDERVREAMTG